MSSVDHLSWLKERRCFAHLEGRLLRFWPVCAHSKFDCFLQADRNFELGTSDKGKRGFFGEKIVPLHGSNPATLLHEVLDEFGLQLVVRQLQFFYDSSLFSHLLNNFLGLLVQSNCLLHDL